VSLTAHQPSEASFSPQHPWALPFKAFLQMSDRGRVPSPLSAPALSRKTSYSLAPALQRLNPTHLAVPLFAPQSFTPGRGLMLSWALRPLRLSLRMPTQKAFSAFQAPSHPSSLPASQPAKNGASGLLLHAAWLSPTEMGAGLSGLPHQLLPPSCSNHSQVTDYFFISRPLKSLRTQSSLSLLLKQSSTNARMDTASVPSQA